MDILNKKLLSKMVTLLMFILLLAAGSIVSVAAYKATQKQKVVAGAIFNFIKFVEWENNSADSNKSFNMCLQQYDSAFEPFTQRQVHGKTIKLVLLGSSEQVNICHALYLNSTDKQALDILKKYKDTATLTISEQVGFLSRGGILELGSQNNRLIFSINQHAAKENYLNIGFQLLSLAKHVKES